MPSDLQELTFNYLGEKFRDIVGVEEIDVDVLKTLSLYSDREGYNNAACMLSDRNAFSGVDMAQFGDTISVIKNRKCLKQISCFLNTDL